MFSRPGSSQAPSYLGGGGAGLVQAQAARPLGGGLAGGGPGGANGGRATIGQGHPQGGGLRQDTSQQPALPRQPHAESGGAYLLGGRGSSGAGGHSSPSHTSRRAAADVEEKSPQRPVSAATSWPSQGGFALGGSDARVRELERANAELERMLDDDGRQFLEALMKLENEIEDLTKANKKLLEERAHTEEQLRRQGTDGELRAKNLKLEQDCQDMLRQLDEFEREKDDELKAARHEATSKGKQLEEQTRTFQRKLADWERERTNLLEAMTEESKELQSRVDKLTRDKEALGLELAKARARADVGAARGGGVDAISSPMAPTDNSRLRAVTAEHEKLKDEVTSKDGHLESLKGQLAAMDRKLRMADMETNMLKQELEQLRRDSISAAPRHSPGGQAPVRQGSRPTLGTPPFASRQLGGQRPVTPSTSPGVKSLASQSSGGQSPDGQPLGGQSHGVRTLGGPGAGGLPSGLRAPPATAAYPARPSGGLGMPAHGAGMQGRFGQ